MKISRRIRKHIQDVLLGAGVIRAVRLEGGNLVPDGQPLLLHVGHVVGLVHEIAGVLGGHGHRLQATCLEPFLLNTKVTPQLSKYR